jgi:hypothetical protein
MIPLFKQRHSGYIFDKKGYTLSFLKNILNATCRTLHDKTETKEKKKKENF